MSAGQRVSLEPAYVLHQRPYKDSSLLLEVFSFDHGCVGLIAKGVRKKRGRWQSLLQPFMPLLISWSGRGDLRTVTDVELQGSALPLNGKFLFSAFYVNELLMYLVHRDDPQPQLFECYSHLMSTLDVLNCHTAGQEELERVLRIFERDLLQECGYGLVLDYDVVSGDALQPERGYRYRLGEGPSLAGNDEQGPAFKGASLIALRVGQLNSAECLRDAKRLLRAALEAQLGGRVLKSRKMMLDLLRTSGNNATLNSE